MDERKLNEIAESVFGDSAGMILMVKAPVGEDIHACVMNALGEAQEMHVGPPTNHWSIRVMHGEDCGGRAEKSSKLCTCESVIAFCRAISDEEAKMVMATGSYDQYRDLDDPDEESIPFLEASEGSSEMN